MSQELFADRIGDITVANGMVRIDGFGLFFSFPQIVVSS